MLLEPGGETGAVGFLDRDEVLDADRVQQLPAKAFRRDPGADALAGGIDRRGRTGRTAADDEHVEGLFRAQLRGLAFTGRRIELGDDLLEFEAALAEGLAVEKDGWHGHDLALVDFLLKQRAVDHRVPHFRIEHGHEVERLHDVGAELATERYEGLELEFALEGADLLEQSQIGLGRIAADLQQREHE